MGAEQLFLAATAAASAALARCWWHLAIIRSLQSLNESSGVNQCVCVCEVNSADVTLPWFDASGWLAAVAPSTVVALYGGVAVVGRNGDDDGGGGG